MPQSAVAHTSKYDAGAKSASIIAGRPSLVMCLAQAAHRQCSLPTQEKLLRRKQHVLIGGGLQYATPDSATLRARCSRRRARRHGRLGGTQDAWRPCARCRSLCAPISQTMQRRAEGCCGGQRAHRGSGNGSGGGTAAGRESAAGRPKAGQARGGNGQDEGRPHRFEQRGRELAANCWVPVQNLCQARCRRWQLHGE